MISLLDVKNLSVFFFMEEGTLRAVDGVSFSLEPGKVLGIVGESGSGKTITALSLLRLVPSPGKIVSGEIFLQGKNLLELPESDMVEVRGKKISMIFQDPMTSLNPVFSIGDQVAEALQVHEKISRKAAKKKALEMLDLVRIPAPSQRYEQYPHQLSGGLRQRVMIAVALACRPLVLIADEPTTALDVTIQSQILELLKDLQSQFRMSVLYITHNLGIVAGICDEVLIMYTGRVVERAPVQTLFSSPRHPYTVGLLTSVPRLDWKAGDRLHPIPGKLPTLWEKPAACTFAPRCSLAENRCLESEPDLYRVGKDHESRCFFHERVKKI